MAGLEEKTKSLAEFLKSARTDKAGTFLRDGGAEKVLQGIATPSQSSAYKRRATATQDDNNNQLTAVQKLGKVTRNKRAARKIAKNKDTVNNLCNAIKTKPRFSKLVEYSIECLTNLAVDEISIEEMIDEGALETILNAMKLNPYNERVAQAVNKCIKKFAHNDYLSTMIMEKVGPDSLVFSLKKHVEPETLVETCGALKNLMTNADNVDKLVNGGVVEALAHMAAQNIDSPEVAAAAAACASTIAEHPKHAQRLMDSGLVTSIMDAMKANPDDPKLTRSAANLIGNIAAAGDADIIAKLRDMGAVDLLTKALDDFPEDDDLKAIGANALKMLAGVSDMKSAIDLIKTGNMGAVALAMSKIAGLVLVDDNVEYMMVNGGLEVCVSAAMSAIKGGTAETGKIVEASCRALARLCTTEDNAYKVLVAGGAKMAISALKNGVTDEKVAAAALQLLGAMSNRKENADYILKCGGIEAALAALKANPDSAAVAKHALRFFQSVGMHEGFSRKMAEAGVMSAIIKAMSNNIDNPELVKDCLLALGRMADSKEMIELLSKSGGLEALLDVLAAHMDDAETVKQVLTMLETAALLPENVEKMRELGAMEAILKALEAHVDDEDIQGIGSRTIARIAGDQQLQVSIGSVTDLTGRLQKSPALSTPIIRQMGPAIRLLSNLAMIPENVGYLSEHGGVEALAQAFVLGSKAPKSEDRDGLLNAAAQGLFRLTQSPDNCMQIVQAGAFKAMMAHCLENSENEELAENVCRLGFGLSAIPEAASVMIQDGSLFDIIELVKVHPLNEALLASAAQALTNLCVDDNAVAKVIEAGGADVLTDAVYANMGSVKHLTELFESMAKMARNPTAARAIVGAGGLDSLIDAFRRYPEDAPLVNAALKAMNKLMQVPETGEALVAKGGLPLLLRALRDHYAEEELVQNDICLLDKIAQAGQIEPLSQPDLGAQELVEWAAMTFEDNAAITEAAGRLLDALTSQTEHAQAIEVEMAQAQFAAMTEDDVKALLDRLRACKDPEEMKGLLKEIAALGVDPERAQLLIKQGALETLAGLMKGNKDNENLFKAAAAAFTTISDGPNELSAMEVKSVDSAIVEALVEMIKPHALFAVDMSPEEIVQALDGLSKLKLTEANVSNLLDQGVLEPLLKFLTTSDDPHLLEAAARVLAKMSNNDGASQLLASLADLRALIAAMRRHMELPNFLKFAVYLLANLAVSEQMKQAIGMEGGIQVIIQIMQKYPMDQPLIENCDYALGNLSFESETNISFIVACKGIEEIILSMDNFPTAPELLESAVCAICNLCFKNDSNKKKIVDLGGARAVVACMLDNVNETDLLLASFRTLGNLAFYPPNITTIIKEGGVQAIVAAMTLHSNHMDIIDMAIRVLANLAAEVDDAHMTIMADEGAVQAIVDVATGHTDNLDIEVSAFGCLYNFARAQRNSRMIVLQGGLRALNSALKALNFDAELCEKGARLAAALTYNAQNIADMVKDPIVDSLRECVQQHLSALQLVVAVLSMFSNLSYSKDNAEILATKGVVQMCLTVIGRLTDKPPVLMEVCYTLAALCRSEVNATSMAESVLRSLEPVVTMHAQNGKLLQAVFTLISNMVIFPAAADGCTKTGIVRAMLHAVRAQMSEHLVLMRGLRALENLAIATNVCKDHLKSQGVIEAMNQIIANYMGKMEEVSTSAQRVIDAINTPILAAGTEEKVMARKARSVRDIFGDHSKDKVPDLPIAIVNLFTSGVLMQKHSKTAVPRSRHVFITPDLKYLCWKDPKKPLENKQKMKTFMIRSVEVGRVTPQLQRKKRFGGYYADEDKCFAIMGRERTIDLEAKDEAERDKWVKALEMLIEHIKAKKKVATDFV